MPDPSSKAPAAARLFQTLALLVVVLGLAFAGRLMLMRQDGGGNGLGGAFTLVDSSGKTVHDTDFRGRWMLIYFGYTFCPDVCPTTLATIARAVNTLPKEKQDKLATVFVTIDPDRDTPAVVGSYVKAFSPTMIGLSGSPDQIAVAAKAYRIYYAKVDDKGGAANAYTMDHTSVAFLLDGEGHNVTFYDQNVTAEAMAADLAKRID